MSQIGRLKAVTVGVQGKHCFGCDFTAVEGDEWQATTRCTLYNVQIQGCDLRDAECIEDFGYKCYKCGYEHRDITQFDGCWCLDCKAELQEVSE